MIFNANRFRYFLLLGLLVPSLVLGMTDEEILDEILVEGSEEILPVEVSELLDDSLDIDPLFSLFSVGTDPISISPAISSDPFKDLKGLGGEVNVDRFSGGGGYSYPFSIPAGRAGMTPPLSLQYSTHSDDLASRYGYGWSLPQNGIYRSTQKGLNTLYDESTFTANIFGRATELLETDSANGIYMPRYEGQGGFTKFVFSSNQWTATDTSGTQYTFGSAARQSDPEDSTRVHQWMLERVEDRFGNFMTFSYTSGQGQVYPDTIRYTGHGTDQGLYEVRFVYESQLPYAEYTRAFRVTTEKRLKQIELYNHANGSAEISRLWELGYEEKNSGFLFLTSITPKAGTEALPATTFDYYDGTESGIDYKPFGLLHLIETPYRASQELIYKPSTAYKNSNGFQNKIPFLVETLYQQKTKAHPNAVESVTTYDYSGGHYYFNPADVYKSEYAGFETVEITDPVGNKQTIWFHQSEFSNDHTDEGEYLDHLSKKGRVYREEFEDDQGNIFRTVIRKWNHTQLPDENAEKDRFFVALDQEVTVDFDGDTDQKVKAISFLYDAFGNTTETTDWGEVLLNDQAGGFTDVGDDLLKTVTTYAQNPVPHMYAFPSETIGYDINGGVLGHQKQYYDGLILGQVDKGAWTKTEDAVDATNWITKRTEYNAKGLPTRVINGRNFATDFGYDAYDLYVTSVTNAKNQNQIYGYDYRFGVPSVMTDENGAVQQRAFDGFGRVVGIQQTDPDNPTQLQTHSTYVYQDTNYPTSIKERKWLSDTIQQERVQYQDGLGRPIQIKSLLDENWIKADTIHDLRGNVERQNLPVAANGEAYEVVDPNGVGTSFLYDPLNRPTQSISPVGTTQTAYDQWERTTTDALGNIKVHAFDSRDQLIRVDEHLDGVAHSTAYTFSPLGYMTSVTDPLGNTRSNTYDYLGRMLSEEDLHHPTDTTYGVTTYVHDDEGNVVSKQTPNGDTLAYVYDSLNRLLTENINGVTIPTVSYVYDLGTNGIGRVSSITSTGGVKDYGYDILGRVLSDTKTIDGTIFILQKQYDRQGNVVSLTYPDGTVVTNGYEPSGSLQSISVDGQAVITNVDYAPTGLNSSITFSNGITTTDTFDPNQLYRITKRVSQNTAGDKLQDIDYSYDAVGNILTIQDDSQTNAAKTSTYLYDDLYRLTNATITNSANAQDYTRTWSYDITGNMLTHSENGVYLYAGNDGTTANGTNSHPHAVTSVGATAYSYDDNGNLLSNGTWTHTWDAKDRLTSSTDGTTTVQYSYDEAKDRLTKHNTSTGKKTYYIDQYYDLEDVTGKAHVYLGTRKVLTKKTDTTQ